MGEPERGTETQRRRKRIMDVALVMASTGGYEAVQMRAVAQRSGVAVGTLYRYFPSKVHLLVSALGREFEHIVAEDEPGTIAAGSASQRLHHIIDRLNRGMQRNPLLAEAMACAFVFADASAAAEVDRVSKLIDSMFARAINTVNPPRTTITWLV